MCSVVPLFNIKTFLKQFYDFLLKKKIHALDVSGELSVQREENPIMEKCTEGSNFIYNILFVLKS